MKKEYVQEITADGELSPPEDIRGVLQKGDRVRVTLEKLPEGESRSPSSPSFSYGRQTISGEDIEAAVRALRSDWLTGGPRVREFEEALAHYCGARHCVVTANGTAALHIAALALGIGPGDIGLTSPLTFMASSNCILYCGGRPDFADIDPGTLCLSPDGVEEYCRRKGAPKAVIPVDFAGVPAQLTRFRELSDRYGFKVIEDAAHAIGSRYTHNGESHACGACAHSDLAILSFHPVKTITSGEGGAVLTNDDALARKVRMLGNHGIERDGERFLGLSGESEDLGGPQYGPWYHEMHSLGFNYRITDIQCALGLAQMTRLGGFKARRQAIVRRYNERFASPASEGLVTLPPWPDKTDPCFHLYVLRFEEGAERRKRVFMGLRDRNIHTQVHYIPVHLQPYYRRAFGYRRGDFPLAESYYEKALSLPLYPVLTDQDVDFVAESVLDLLKD